MNTLEPPRTNVRRLMSLSVLVTLALLTGCAAAEAEMATRSLTPATVENSRADAAVTFDLKPLAGRPVLRAELRLRAEGDVTVPGLEPAAPWFDAFDATGAAGRAAKATPPTLKLTVRGFDKVEPDSVRLDVAVRAAPSTVPPQVKGVAAFHRAGQTFITFREIDDRSAEPAPKWSVLKARLDAMDAAKRVRYLVFRHDRPITAATLPEAERLARVRPMSGYNARGRSVDELICTVRRQAVGDALLARKLARSGYFKRYTPDHPNMGQVAVERFAVRDGERLPPRTGLYVHHPAKPGKAYYAVVSCVDGVANTRDLDAANSTSKPLAETVGPGVPVRQGKADVTVFFDVPGERFRYVQWAGPSLTHRPSEYYNWGVFVPRDYGKAGLRRLSVFFHDGNQRYLKPPWPHRQDQVLLSPHDAPFASFGYGHNDALGTLTPLRKGTVRPFFARRVDAVVAWAMEHFEADAGRVSCGGRGYWGGTAALQYGLRRPGRIGYVMAESSPDPDPKSTPDTYVRYPWRKGRPRPTGRGQIDRVWGRPEWKLPCESGKSIWEEADLPAFVRASEKAVPYLSLGSGSMSVTWKQQTDLMKAYKESRNGFLSRFYWGGTGMVPLPKGRFEPRADRPLLACWPLGFHPKPDFFEKYFFPGKRGYSGGSRLNDRIRWGSEDVVDTAERLEMTIWSDRSMTYAGTAVAETTVRNARKFRPAPGETLTWKAGKQGGEIRVGKDGLIIIPKLAFTGTPTRLVITRGKE
jgi:hypothetical protein